MAGDRKPLPVADPVSEPYWAGCRRHELLLQRCGACGDFRFPPAPLCPRCRSPHATWTSATGAGRVYSWIVVMHPVPDVYATDVPYVIALVELDEGVRMPTNIVGCAPDAIQAGMPVEVVFDDVAGGVTLPKFRPLRRDDP